MAIEPIQSERVFLVYATASQIDEARSLGQAAVESGLAACCNILPAIESIYQWQGSVQTEVEFAFLLKTVESRVQELTDFIVNSHSYTCPCVVAWPIDGGNASFLSWVEAQLQAK